MKKHEYKSPSSFEIFTKCDLKDRFQKFSNINKRSIRRIKKPIFVVGCPRSGTTVLGKCLSAHPEIAGGEESLFLLIMWTVFNEMHQGNNKHGFMPLKDFIDTNKIIDNIGNFSDSIFESLLEKQKKNRYVDHTPWYVLLTPFINLIYPDAIFIHLVRDGRRVVNSLSNSYENGFRWAGQDIKERTHLWVNLVEHGLNIKNNIANNRYLQVKYEDLYQYPVQTLTKILSFAKLKFNENVLKPLTETHADPVTKNVALNPQDLILKNKMIVRDLDVNWPIGWSDRDKKDFMSVGKSLMRHLYLDIKV